MPPLLRPRLVCHYCGERSKSKLTGSRKFKCERCESINFLDEVRSLEWMMKDDADDIPDRLARSQMYLTPRLNCLDSMLTLLRILVLNRLNLLSFARRVPRINNY